MPTLDELREKKLLTRDDAAQYIGVCKNSLDKMIHQRTFPALVRIGRRVFIHRERLDKWLDEQAGK